MKFDIDEKLDHINKIKNFMFNIPLSKDEKLELDEHIEKVLGDRNQNYMKFKTVKIKIGAYGV